LQSFLDETLRVNKEFSYIAKEIARLRKPSKNGKTYSLESQGVFVGHNGVAKAGLVEFKPSFANSIMAYSAESSMATPTMGATMGDADIASTENMEDINWVD